MNYSLIGLVFGTVISVCYCEIYDCEIKKIDIDVNPKIFLILVGGIVGPMIGSLYYE
jgi:hypothetical protein